LAVEFGAGAAREGRREDGEVVAGEWVLVGTVLCVGGGLGALGSVCFGGSPFFAGFATATATATGI
jgi:hypothetical protein